MYLLYTTMYIHIHMCVNMNHTKYRYELRKLSTWRASNHIEDGARSYLRIVIAGSLESSG